MTAFLSPIPKDDWRERAGCLGYDPEWWFPSGKIYSPADTAAAVDICDNLCPVRRECLDFAIHNGIGHGIYGGKTPEERDKIKRRRRRQRWIPRRKGQAGGQ